MLSPWAATAAITSFGAVHYGMARQFQTFADSGRAAIQVFRDIERARQWLAERTASPPPDPASRA